MPIKTKEYYKCVCIQCGRQFVAFSPAAKYCTKECCRNYNLTHPHVKNPRKVTNRPRTDSYCPVRSRFDYLEERTFGAGRKAIDGVQGTSTRTLRRHG